MLKRFLIGLLIGLGVFLVLGLVWAAFTPKTFGYSKTVTVNASKDQVWQHVSSLQAVDKWSPWSAKDPAIKQTWEGDAGAVGSSNCWESEVKEVGIGCQTITEVRENEHVGMHLDFKKPDEAEGEAFIDLEESANGTDVTWGFTFDVPYPFNIIVKLTADMESNMEPDWTNGLNKLKALAEASAQAVPQAEMEVAE